jgi:group I intron endonuclease
MKKTFNYVYLIINKINGKCYIGSHSTNNISDIYLGSGKLIIKAIKKYKKQNFLKYILKQKNNKKESYLLEEYYIDLFNTLIPSGYNISPKGGHNIPNSLSKETKKKIGLKSKGRKHTKEAKRKISIANKGQKRSEETKRKISKKIKGERNGMFGKKGILSPVYGRKLSNQQKEYLRQLYLNKTWEELYGKKKALKMKSKMNHRGEKNTFYGKHHSQKTKNIISLKKRKYNIPLDIIENIKNDKKKISYKEIFIKYEHYNSTLIRRIVGGEYDKGYYKNKIEKTNEI